MSDIQIRWARPKERGPILNFIEQMGFNPRDAVTWDGLEMVAMSAWQGARLIGVIPLEPRPLRVGENSTAWAMHETVVAMHRDHRGMGLGSAMQRAIFESLPKEVQLVSVFREEPDSPAYRWYLKNSFAPAMHVDSWFYEGRPEYRIPALHLFSPDNPHIPWDLIDEIWRDGRRTDGGFVDQSQRSLRSWLPVHPYRERYTFTIAVERGGQGRSAGYALLGMGTMHSDAKRCDILELISTGNAEGCRALLDVLIPFAFQRGCKTTRWPLAAHDPNTQIAESLGFQKKWGFDMLVRPLDSSFILPPSSFKNWRYAPIDYI